MVEKATRRDAMVGAATGLLAVSAGPVRSAQAQQEIAAPNPGQTNPSAPTTFAQVTKPANGVIMPEGYVRAMAQFAYLWGWPLVNMVSGGTDVAVFKVGDDMLVAISESSERRRSL